MKWIGRRQSSNVEDRRGVSGRGLMGIGGIGALVIGLVSWFITGNPGDFFNNLLNVGQEQTITQTPQQQDEMAQFVGVVLADTEDVWDTLFVAMGKTYVKPKLVIFTTSVESACGYAQSATGPFYCGGDSKVYIDLDFLVELQNRLGAQGDFAQAYIIAHEVGHHVQNLLGTLDKVHNMQSNLSEEEYNALSVRLELQADFLAGVWAHHAQKMKSIMESGDLEEAINAAGAVGDDRIMMKNQGYVVPDSFTHGTSEQRTRWFRKGFETGDIRQGDTFNAKSL